MQPRHSPVALATALAEVLEVLELLGPLPVPAAPLTDAGRASGAAAVSARTCRSTARAHQVGAEVTTRMTKAQVAGAVDRKQ